MNPFTLILWALAIAVAIIVIALAALVVFAVVQTLRGRPIAPTQNHTKDARP